MTEVPNLFGTRDQLGEDNFSTDSREGNGLGDNPSALHLLCTYFYYYCISPTSDHQALDPRGWGPLPYDN